MNRFLRLNWKTALWSAIYRAPIFFAAGFRDGFGTALQAGGVEIAFRLLACGWSGAWTETLRNLRPTWLAFLLIAVLIPAFFHWLEWLVHVAAGTPNLKAGMIGSIVMTVIATLFNWYAMKRGALLTAGSEAGSFAADLRKMPSLVLGFAAWPLRAAVAGWRAVTTAKKEA